MRRLATSLAVLAFAACATVPPPVADPVTTTPAAVVVATPPPTTDCGAGNAILNATLWMQSAAEYRASALQAYAAARRSLDLALADPNWTAEPQQTGAFQRLPPAVILDLDETVLDNSPYEARVIKAGKTFDAAMWTVWVNESAAPAIPGAAEFLRYAASRGVTPFYITNRDSPDEYAGTLRNLQKLGLPLASDDSLLTRGKTAAWKVSDKGPRRAHVASTHRVLLLIGDDLNDFADARSKSVAERDKIIADTTAWWGQRWFMLPNAMYGSWERAITSGTGPPCEQMQKKIDALRP